MRWIFSRRVVHTVTFLPPGQKRPTLEVPDPVHPYTGFADAAGAPFWFNGQPSLLIPPKHAFPQGGSSTDGTSYKNSGLSAPAFKPYQLKFTKAGTLVQADVTLAQLAGVVPRLLARQRLGEAMRTIAVGRDALVVLPAMPGRAVLAIESGPATLRARGSGRRRWPCSSSCPATTSRRRP